VLMHWRGHSANMAALAQYDDVVADVRAELLARVDEALAAGVAPGQLVLDPGLGFAKNAAHNWALLAQLEAFTGTGLPVLIGASRKSFLGSLLADPHGTPRPTSGREAATTALTVFAALHGVWGVRVHEVAPNVDAALVAAAIRAVQ
jgi:dihydropteroate synthase